jgi:hypothetical protein
MGENEENYTVTRISRTYLEKLRAMAKAEKRSMLKMLETLIDEKEKQK